MRQNSVTTEKEGKARKKFFFEKKNQKTSPLGAPAPAVHPLQWIKVFCFFFSKKKAFLS
jgi:hypothetical protein